VEKAPPNRRRLNITRLMAQSIRRHWRKESVLSALRRRRAGVRV